MMPLDYGQPRRFLLQMAGESGTGKSTMARAIGRCTGAVVLDRDYFKAPLLEEGIDDAMAGGLAYAIYHSVAASVLEQGHNVILDSAAFYPSIIERGRDLAAEFDIGYYLIECHCSDASIHDARLRTREHVISQPVSLAQVLEQRARPGIVEIGEPHLLLDTSEPLEASLEKALEYLAQ